MCSFATVDARGAVYVFHLRANRFSRVHDAKQEVTAVAFAPGRESDLILGLADHSIRIISSDTGATIATLKSHRQAVMSICVHPMGRFLVSCSLDACVLWDLKSLKRLQNIGSSGRIGAIQAAFLHSGNTLITLSRAEGLSLYHFPTLRLRARLTPVAGKEVPHQRLQFRAFAITPNRMYIVAAASGSRAYVWHLPSETMIEEISLPVPCATRAYGAGTVQPLMPYASVEMPESSQIAYVADDGLIRIMDLPSGRVVKCVGVAAHAFAMYKHRIALSSADGSVRLCSLAQVAASKGSRGGAATPDIGRQHEGRGKLCDLGGAGREVENMPANKKRPPSVPPSFSHASASAQAASLPSRVRSSNASSQVRSSQDSVRRSVEGVGGGRGVTGVSVRTSPSKTRPSTAQPVAPSFFGDNRADGLRASGDVPSAICFNPDGGQPVASGPKALKQAQLVERLRAFLDVHAAFTDDHRVTVYREALRLPGNAKAHAALTDMGLHPLVATQLDKYTIADSRQRLRLARVVHGIAQWCEALACSDFLPAFVYPWLGLFGRDECLCLEACLMFLLNWAKSWFQFWPSPPLQLLGAVDRLLFVLDPKLVRHLVSKK